MIGVTTGVAVTWGLVACSLGGLGSGSTGLQSENQMPAPPAATIAGQVPSQPSVGGGVAAAGFGQSAPTAPIPGSKVKLAMLLPLSARGQAAPIAKGLKRAAEMALFEHNNPNIEMVFKDTAGTQAGARNAAQDAIAEGAELILGPLYGENVKAIAATAQSARTPVIAFSNNTAVAGHGVYLLSFTASEEADRIAKYAVGQGKRRIAVLVPNDSYGKLINTAFANAVRQSGGEIVMTEWYPPGANGVLKPARRLLERIKKLAEQGQPIDAMFIPDGPETLPDLAPLLRYANINAQTMTLLGSGGWDYPNVGKNGAFVGGVFPAPDPKSWNNFSARYVKTYGTAPPRIATLAYDATGIAISLSRTHPPGQRYTDANLMRSSGFLGVDGPVRFSSIGVPQRNLAIVEVQSTGLRVIEPAPPSFAAVQGYANPLQRTNVATTAALQ